MQTVTSKKKTQVEEDPELVGVESTNTDGEEPGESDPETNEADGEPAEENTEGEGQEVKPNIDDFPSLADVLIPDSVCRIHVNQIYVDDSISGRLGGRDEKKFKETKHSIEADGQIEAVGIGLAENGAGVLYSGFGRVRAITELFNEGKHDGFVKAVLWEGDVTQGYLAGVLSNTKREDLNPVQLAGIIETLYNPPFKLNAKDIAKKLDIAPSYVRGLRKILELPDDVQQAVKLGKLGPAAAIEYARNPEEGAKIARKQLKLAEGLNAPVATSEAREAMREAKGGKGGIRTLKEVKVFLEDLIAKEAISGSLLGFTNALLNFADGLITPNKFKSVIDSGADHARIIPEKPKKAAKKGAKKATKKAAKKPAKKAKKSE